ncbi:hypothetical protein CVT24_006908 [Panaeolus cyanescens]|uniref:Uncharacterized protein n=1 Tax=Panaeolus cyanescens TaxID=181874 RepID=A0A409VK46_9AGAR|nr:hypothetical protein CVT24_006908 [Panaeolus cyanescens]
MMHRFLKVFNELPPEGQQMLIEKHLAKALDDLEKEKSDDILFATTQLQSKYSKAPNLDLRKKRQQITMLMDELARDAKLSFIKERSNRDELLTEIIHTLVTWLNDIWSVAYEHQVNFALAHTCLVFVGDAMIQLQENASLGGCKCSVLGLPIDVKIKDKNSKVIQKFHVIGPQNIDQILLWIWRDVLVSIFLSGTQRDKDKVADFLTDIESVFGITALERLLQGGKGGQKADFDDFEDWDEDDDDHYETESEDEDYFSEDFECIASGSPFCPCSFHGRHWSETVNNARLPLRQRVEARLLSIFQTSPSLEVYNSLISISLPDDDMEDRLTDIIHDIAGYTPDNLVAALEIFSSIGQIDDIAHLLSEHSDLLRPRDWHKLQLAVTLMDADSTYQTEVFDIVERELNDCLQCIFATVRSSFCHIDEETFRTELKAILKLQRSAPGRKSRIQHWVDHVVTSGNPLHPMAFAAMMMGLPMIPPGDEGDDADVFSYMDFDPNDSDLDDLREEYRPNHRSRFDGWRRIASDMVGGQKLLLRVYSKAIEIMPWLQDGDIISEMVTKLSERPNKDHVLDALGSLNSFAKSQRKAIRMAQKTSKKRQTSTTKTTTTTVINSPTVESSSAPTSADNTTNSPSPTVPPLSPMPSPPLAPPQPGPANVSAPPSGAGPSTVPNPPLSPPHNFSPTLAQMSLLASAFFGPPAEDPDSDGETTSYPPIPFEILFPPPEDAGGLDDVD